MNNPNPFVPQGSLLEQQSQRRSRLKLAVFCVLSVCVVGLVAMLIQGCKRENPETTTPPVETNNPPAFESSNTPAITESNTAAQTPAGGATAAASQQPGQPAGQPSFQLPPQQPQQQPQLPPTPEAGGSSYVVVQGDSLAKIAKAHGVTLKALEAANPGVDSKKLKIKQTLVIPPSTKSAETATTGATAGAAPAASPSGSEKTYTVKSGDTLAKVAKKNGIKLKALRAANPKIATTDHIHVGDKLVIPSKGETAAPAAAPETTATPVLPLAPQQPAAPVTPATPAR